MDWLMDVNWESVFLPEMPLLEIFARGTLVYLGIFVLLRTLLRHEIGMVALPDILTIVLLADAAQNAIADDYRSVPDGLLLVLVIVFWNFMLDRLAFRYPLLERFIHPPPMPLIRHGRILWENLRREAISKEELWTQLRAHGIEDVAEVKSAQLEANGEITVIKYRKDEDIPRRRLRPR